jgi:hypothetical protein
MSKPHTILACALFALSGVARADWVVAPEFEAVRPLPDKNQVQPQNPPSFSWSRHKLAVPGYVIEVKAANGSTTTYNATRNWYLPSKALAAGAYTWRVRPSNSTEWSDPRGFSIDASSMKFEVPEDGTLRAVLKLSVRPRQLPKNFVMSTAWTEAMKAERARPLQILRSEVDYKIPTMAAVKDSDWPLVTSGTVTAATNAQSANIRQRINNTGRQLEAAALLHKLTGEQKYLDEALRRGDELAALSPTGPTSYANQDQGTRVISLSLIKAYDLLTTKVDATRKARWLSMVDLRTTDIFKSLSSANRLDQYPFDSHGGTNLGFLAVISTLAVGDIPNASTWFDFSFRSYVNTIYAWSGPEGGFANGTAYGQYTADYALQIWQPLTQSTGVNLFKKPWSLGFLQFFSHFVPPGATTHVFGDEQELKPDFRYMKAYASRFDTPQAAWYAQNISGDEDTLTLLQAPHPLPYKNVAAPVAPPNAALYPSIGWVAMHSNMSDIKRTSVFFKSSPYGAYNHSHGDQNSLVVTSGGRPLLIETGYLDYYGSPLFNDWYRKTKAHNAITFDGGIGQLTDGNTINLSRNGKITAFSTSSAMDYAEGDATPAYGTAVGSAIRKIWYLRNQDAVVVQDKLASGVARKWEWNLHGAAPIVAAADGSISITNMDRSVCVRPLINDAAYAINFETRTAPAPKPGTFESHGAFVTPSSTRGEFLMLVDVGCKKPTVSITEGATSRTIVIGAQSVTVPN